MQARSGEAILVPAKELARAKSRLGPWLDSSARSELAVAMLGDVLQATAGWPSRFVVTADPLLAEVAAGSGCLPLPDPGGGLNAALLVGTGRAVEAGAAKLLVLPSDVPLVEEADVAALFALTAPVVVVPSPDGGTAGLLRTPPGVIDPAFGPHSAMRHAAAARWAGIPVLVTAAPSLVLDVDGPADLQRLADSPLERTSTMIARRLLGARTG
jgi:2-phospho-L-lactate/phosphoenolpyruvate guanylyltransferase